MTLDFRTTRVGGTSTLVFDVDDVQISLGAWTVVTIGKLSLEFDRDTFDWTSAWLQDPMSPGMETLVHAAFSAAARMATVMTFRQVAQQIEYSYRDGVQHGEQRKLEQIKAVLDL